MGKKTKRQTSAKDARRLYNDLAWTWPIISLPKDYREEATHYKKVFTKYSRITVKTLLNLGCGGGNVDWVLKKSFAITGVDISTDMLQLARKLNPEVIYQHGDMRKVRLGRLFDAVLIHDSINYMLTAKDLRSVFKTAYLHLRPGGMLLTYAEEHGYIKQHSTKSSTHRKGNIEITFIEHQYDPNPQDTTFESTFVYLVRKNKKLDIYTDRHLSGVFPLTTWQRLLKEIGFQVIRRKYHHSEFPKGTYFPEFVCLKPL